MTSKPDPPALPPPQGYVFSWISSTPPRLGLDLPIRLPATALSGFATGLVLGAALGSQNAAFRFRAENAHRFPTSSIGWYQYHRTKSYKSIVGGVKEGFKFGSKLAVGALTFCILEETVDRARNGQRDFIATTTAGLSLSGLYSLIARHDIYTAARTTKLGFKLSLGYGLLQDVLSTLKGNSPAYVRFFTNKFHNSDKEEAI